MSIFNTSQIGRIAALLLLLCCAWPCRARAEIIVPGLEIDPRSGVDMRITSIFKTLPRSGFATLQIYIHNTSGQARTWSFNFTSSSYGQDQFLSTREFSVPNNTEKTFEVLVPLLTNASASYPYVSTNLQIAVTGYGVTRGFAGLNTGGSSGRPLTDFVLMSQGLTVRSWGPLDKTCSDRGEELQGCDFNPYFLPTDWRGYIGVGTFWITDSEWQGLDPVQLNAIREWILQGGSLIICAMGPHQVHDFGFNDEQPGYGHVRVMQWDGKELDSLQVLPLIASTDNSIATSVESGYGTKWDLMSAIGGLQFNGAFIMMFVIGFGLVIGPLNLFWFAKSGSRHRLFWTTPLISIAGSVLLAVVIVLEDGFGGTGKRMDLVQLIPGDNEEVVTQEQLSRTGLLLSTSFQTEDKVFIAPIFNLPFLSGAGHVPGANNRKTYSMDGKNYGGDWFSSRSMQAFLIEVIRPSRSRIEIIPAANGGKSPVLVSSVENDLDQVFYIDGDGNYWQTDRTRVGEKKSLQPSTEDDFNKWITSNTHEAGARINYLLRQAMKRRGYFYAVADDPKNDPVATMSSIRWSNAKTIYLGPCAGETGAAKP